MSSCCLPQDSLSGESMKLGLATVRPQAQASSAHNRAGLASTVMASKDLSTLPPYSRPQTCGKGAGSGVGFTQGNRAFLARYSSRGRGGYTCQGNQVSGV